MREPHHGRHGRRGALALGALLLGVYCANGTCLEHGDPVPSAFAAMGLAYDGDPTLDRYVQDPNEALDHTVVRSNDGGLVSVFGFGAPLWGVPVLGAARLLGAAQSVRLANMGGKVAGALAVAASAAVLWCLVEALAGPGLAWLMGLAYGLGTCVWPISSQGLWQHGPAALALCVGLWALLAPNPTAWRDTVAGLAFACAAACRPTHALTVLAAALTLALRRPRHLGAFICGVLPIGAAVVIAHDWAYGSWWATGQLRIGARIAMEKTGDPRVWRAPWEGLMGLLVSPSRGVLWFSPFLLLAPWGLRGLAAQPPPQRDATLFAAALGLAFLGVAATWFDWWGGWAYGYRPIVDSMPLWILACTPAVARCARSRAGRVGLALALAWSVGVQGLGAFCSDFAEWNEGSPAHPHEDIDRHRERLWDVADSQILYHLRQPHLKRQMILETANQEAAPLTP